MFKYAIPFIFYLTAVAQQLPPDVNAGTQPSKIHQPLVKQTQPQTNDPAKALSKNYRKSAIIAMASIDDWKQRASEAVSSSRYSDGAVYENRSSIERLADSEANAERDVKLAKTEVTTPADNFLQDWLEIYIQSVRAFTYPATHFGAVNPWSSGDPSKDIDKEATCSVMIEFALNDGNTTRVDEHPEMKCK